MMLKLFLPLLLVCGCVTSPPTSHGRQPLIVVSIAPYAYFVHALAGDTVQVKTLVPEGYNPHIYEGSPKQLSGMENTALWVGLGEPFEEKFLQSLREKNPSMLSLDLTRTVPTMSYRREDKAFNWCGSDPHHNHEGIDRHIWVSPVLAKKQAQTICEELIKLFPSHAEEYKKRLERFIQQLDTLDRECRTLLAPLAGGALLISHPSLGYFCHEYHLVQVPIECEGKSPLPKDLSAIIALIKKFHVKCALTQPQFDNRATLLIAKKMHLSVNEINPYDYDYFTNMKKIATTIAQCPSSQ